MLLRIVLISGFVVSLAQNANADGRFRAGPRGPNGGFSLRSDEYALDDGQSEESIGLFTGGNTAWINQFNVTGGHNRITAVSTTFGSPVSPEATGVGVGVPFKVYVWSDPNNDGSPNDAVLLCTATALTDAAAISTDVFQRVGVGNCDIPGGDGTSFFIGASINQSPNTYPAPHDVTNPMSRSWIAASDIFDGFDPNNVAGGVGVYNLDDIGYSGNWLLRADAVPEPAALCLMSLGLTKLIVRRPQRRNR